MSLTKADLDPVLGKIVTVYTRAGGQMSEGRLQHVTETSLCLYPVLVISSAGELIFTADCVAVLDLAEVVNVRSTPDDVFERTRTFMLEDVKEQQATHRLLRARAKKEREQEEMKDQSRGASPPIPPSSQLRAPGMYL